jgi:hypothetical protein
MPGFLSLRAYARSRRERGLPGGTLNAIQKAIASGRIQLVDGKIDPEAADAAWVKNTSVEQQARGARGGGTPVLEPPAAPSDVVDAESYIVARARKEAALADLAEMEASELRGELVKVEAVTKCWGEMTTAIRARLLVLPSMAAPMIAPPGKASEVQGILRKLVNEALQELSGDGIPEGAKRRARRHAEDPETAT